MAKKVYSYRGMSIEELKALSPEEFLNIVPSRVRRTLKRGYGKPTKKFLEKIFKSEKPTRTHDRNIIVTPQMIGACIAIYNGKEFSRLDLIPEMIGFRLGELVPTRNRVRHSSPGMGATRSSKFVALK